MLLRCVVQSGAEVRARKANETLSCRVGKCARGAREVMGVHKHMWTHCSLTQTAVLQGSALLMEHSWALLEGLRKRNELASRIPLLVHQCVHFPALSFTLSFFLVTPMRTGMRGEIISAQALHHYLPSDKEPGHSITAFFLLLCQREGGKTETQGQEDKI